MHSIRGSGFGFRRHVLRWLLEPDQQNAIAQGGAWSPRLDIASPPGLAPLAELNVANGFLAFITDTAVAQGYRDRFAALVGQKRLKSVGSAVKPKIHGHCQGK